MPTSTTVTVDTLSPASFAPYGWVLGQSQLPKDVAVEFRSTASDFSHQHLFDPGAGGDTEVLWVTYRDASPAISKLEVHHLTQQAVVPLTQQIFQVLCLSDERQAPNLSTLRAFRISPGVGICMRPGVWHTTRAVDATCLMLTRPSTTADLVAHLTSKQPARESTIVEIAPVRLIY